ncbi:hypothetical protein [Solidesulfovibrio sp.]
MQPGIAISTPAILWRLTRQDDGTILLSPPMVTLWLAVWCILAFYMTFGRLAKESRRIGR